MKKTRFFTLLLALMVAVLLCGCKNVPEKTITGDVKDDDQVETGEKITDIPEIKEEEPDVIVDDTPEDEEKQEEAELTPSAIIEGFGAQIGEGGDYFNEAVTFADAICEANVDIVAEFTGGFGKSYGFLSETGIDGYEIYPFEFSNETIESKAEEGLYPIGEDMYLVEYDITKGDGEYFKDGKNIYLMIFGHDAVASGVLRAFVPCERAEEYFYYDVNKYSDFESYFIKEFTALYCNKLSDGKNYPDSFDFKDSVHLITHLMAKCGKYSDYPPFSMEEINEFISLTFDGNPGLNLIEARDFENWMTGASYAVTDEDRENGRLYGCSYGHGGTTAEYSVVSEEWESENTKTVTVQLYSDYSNFAKSKQVIFTIESMEGELPRILLIEIENDTGNSVAYVSI